MLHSSLLRAVVLRPLHAQQVVVCSQTFSSASAFNQNLASWNTVSVANMASMLNAATAFNQNLASWNVLRVNAAGWVNTWTGAAALSGCNGLAIYTAWGATFQGAWPTLNYACTVGSVACALCITNGNIGAAVTAWVTSPSVSAATYGNIVDWNTAAVTSMASVLASKPTFNADISKWNTASVSNMYQVCVYYMCSLLACFGSCCTSRVLLHCTLRTVSSPQFMPRYWPGLAYQICAALAVAPAHAALSWRRCECAWLPCFGALLRC